MNSTSMLWMVDLDAGQDVVFAMSDASGATSFSSELT
jgi:hypothetical protein